MVFLCLTKLKPKLTRWREKVQWTNQNLKETTCDRCEARGCQAREKCSGKKRGKGHVSQIAIDLGLEEMMLNAISWEGNALSLWLVKIHCTCINHNVNMSLQWKVDWKAALFSSKVTLSVSFGFGKLVARVFWVVIDKMVENKVVPVSDVTHWRKWNPLLLGLNLQSTSR